MRGGVQESCRRISKARIFCRFKSMDVISQRGIDPSFR